MPSTEWTHKSSTDTWLAMRKSICLQKIVSKTELA